MGDGLYHGNQFSDFYRAKNAKGRKFTTNHTNQHEQKIRITKHEFVMFVRFVVDGEVRS